MSFLPTPAAVELGDVFVRFMSLADRLDMPTDERAGILGISPVELRLVDRCGSPLTPRDSHRLLRRARYAMPLMRAVAGGVRSGQVGST